MQFDHPLSKEPLPLFSDMPKETTMCRVVCKSNLTRALGADLVNAIGESITFLGKVGAGYAAMHHQLANKDTHASKVPPC